METLRTAFVTLLPLLFLLGTTAFAQLSGTKTVNSAGGADYSSLAAAIVDLNAQGVGSGGITFNVAAGHAETAVNLVITDSTSSSGKPIIFQKSGSGANPLITAGTGAGSTDGIIKIAGTDFLTFDGIDLAENAANTDPATQMEWGYIVAKANGGNGAQHVTIRNCAITLNKANPAATGIYQANHTVTSTVAITVAGAAGTNSNNRYYANAISNVYAGISANGYNDGSPWAYYDHKTEIGVEGGNTITNFGGGGTTCYGIYCIYQDSLKIANNIVNGGAGTTTTTRGIFTSTGFNANVDIYGNTVTLSTGALTSSIYPINNAMGGSLAVPGTTNRVRIYNNIVENMSLSGLTTGTVYMIYQNGAPADCEIYDNIVRNNSKAGTGIWYLIYQAGNVVDSAIVRNNRLLNNTNSGNATLYCIYSNPAATTTALVTDNTIDGNSSAATSASVYGISLSSGLRNIAQRNIIRTLTSLGSGLYGIYHTSSTTAMTGQIESNRIYGFLNNGSGASVHGIFVNSGASVYVVNNYVSDLRAPTAANAVAALSGIYVSGGGTVGAYYNTIFLQGSSAATTFGTSGIYASVTPTVDLRNNNVVNLSIPGALGGTTAAYRRSGTVLSSYAAASNNNNWYAGTPSATRLIFADGTAIDSTLLAFRARVTPRDTASITENPPFVNVSTPPYDLHINVTMPTQIDSGATPVTTPIAVTVDYDADTRDATFPDIGADEFTAPPADITPPSIVYVPLGNTAATTGRPLTANISDPSGVATPLNGPRLYYKKSNDAGWVFDAAPSQTGSDYTFLINYAMVGGGTVSSGDTIRYYVAAQDVPGNAGTNPAGGSGATPPGTVPPPSPAFYLILVQPPDPATNVTPADGATHVGITATLDWAAPAGGAAPTGYKVFFGTDNPPTNIANGTDTGNVLSWDPPGNLLYTTTYYWKIVPYNTVGEAAGCPVWSFSTVPDPTITTYPYSQSFDSTLFPPYGWQDVGAKPWLRTTTGFRTAPGGARVSYTPAGTAILLMPPVNLPAFHRIRFWWKDNDIAPGPEIVNHDTTFFEVSTNGGTGWITLAALSTVLPDAQYNEQVVDLGGFAGTGVLMRWRDVSDGVSAAFGVGLDDIRIEPTTRNVTFRVNMKVKALAGLFDPAADNVTVRGSFNGWGLGDTLSDGDNDSIYVKTIPLLPNQNFAYKFWKTLRGGVEWEDGIDDRQLALGTADTTLPAVYFQDDGPSVAVTFQVNMRVKMLEESFLPGSGDAVTVRGSFNDWGNSTNNPDTLNDPGADSIYATVLQMPSGKTIAYKFWKTLRGGLDYENSIVNRQYFIPLETPTVIPPDLFDKDSVLNLGALALNPPVLSFGTVPVGFIQTRTVKAYNTGSSSLIISSMTSSDPSNFTVASVSDTLAPAGTDTLFIPVTFHPSSMGVKSAGIIIVHDAQTSPDTIAVAGTAGASPKFLSITPDTMIAKDPAKGKFWKPVKRFKGLRPNWANLLDETVAQGGFQPGASESDLAGGMVVGTSWMSNLAGKWKPIKDSAAVRAWVRLTKWDFKKSLGKSFNALQKTLEDKTGKHDLLPARGFDFTTDGRNKPILKQQTKLVPKKQDNILFAEFVAFKMNIAASELGKTPEGFGDLVYENDSSMFDEKELTEVSDMVDRMMTYWRLYNAADFADAYATVHDINRAFVGPFDTASFNVGGLVLNGSVELVSVPFLKAPTPFIVTRLEPTTSEYESGEEFDFEDEEFEESTTPVAAKLYQNYPNPFNPGTTIGFRLLETSQVTVRIYNTLGQEVATLLSGEELEEGYNEVRFSASGGNASQLSSGVYFYRIDAQGLGDEGLHTVATSKMVLLK